ncbi:MFS transporter [Lysinibacter cavernae]|uniref:DHA2 family multidrug resistance protein-like MFS transporter n=1 Tax=Lysinibacter cavernae TaxID=1640652 RepID=A0A7X5R0P7_9MICO|nr:DHA2 family multidrug resistance protein-like MFS transporter [Lysinibacter cavernae]
MSRPSRLSNVASPERAGAKEWIALAALMLPVLLVSVDNTVLSFALPQIAEALQPSATEQLWIIDAYPLVLAGLLVTMGSMGDRFGRRKLLLIGATGFAVISVLATFSETAFQLILARAFLGFFGAMLMPSTMSLLRSTFRDREQRRLAIAIWASGFAAGSAMGPLVGGLLLANFPWGSVFLIAVPVLVPMLILVPLLVRESRDPNPGPIDPLSILLSMVAMFGVVYAIKHFASEGFDVLGVAFLVAGLAVGYLFVRRQLRRPIPLLEVRLFKNGMFSGAILVNLLSVIALVGFLFFVSQHLQIVLGLDPVAAGLVLLPGMIIMIVFGLAIVPIARRVPPTILVPIGLLVSAAAYLLIAVAPSDPSVGRMMLAFAMLGAGIGAAETISNDLILAEAPANKAGAASALSETAYEVGAVLGTALLGGILTANYRSELKLPSALSPADGAIASETLAGAHNVSERVGGSLGDEVMAAATHAFESGVGLTSMLGAILMVAAAVVAWRTLRPQAEPVLTK